MNHQQLLSVIVPCYNVEKYLDKCISSIVNQTYTHLEILLINDGSTDETGARCDSWQAKDRRIRVIHKENEGSSYARKTGAESATGEYIAFVDADDWIDAGMYADMMTALLTTGSDIAQCDVCEIFEDGRMVHRSNEHKTGNFEVVKRTEGVLLILEDNKWRSWMVNKIYRKHLFEGIEFPKGRGFGEDFIAHHLFHKASQTVYLHREYYFYFKRKGSITQAQNIPAEMKSQRDYSDAYFDRYSFVKQHPEYHSALASVKYMTNCAGIHLLRNMIVNPQYFTSDYFYAKSEQLRSISLNQGDKLGRRLKIDFYLLKISPGLYKILRSFYVRIIRVTNRLKITDRPISRSLYDIFPWWQ